MLSSGAAHRICESGIIILSHVTSGHINTVFFTYAIVDFTCSGIVGALMFTVLADIIARILIFE